MLGFFICMRYNKEEGGIRDAGGRENGTGRDRDRRDRQLSPARSSAAKNRSSGGFQPTVRNGGALYCEDNGRPSVDPVVLFKMVLIQHLYGLPSLRRTAEEVSLNIAYRWFLGYSLQEETPHFSTVSYNFRHRFTEETVDQVFRWILEEVAEAGYLPPGRCL